MASSPAHAKFSRGCGRTHDAGRRPEGARDDHQIDCKANISLLAQNLEIDAMSSVGLLRWKIRMKDWVQLRSVETSAERKVIVRVFVSHLPCDQATVKRGVFLSAWIVSMRFQNFSGMKFRVPNRNALAETRYRFSCGYEASQTLPTRPAQ